MDVQNHHTNIVNKHGRGTPHNQQVAAHVMLLASFLDPSSLPGSKETEWTEVFAWTCVPCDWYHTYIIIHMGYMQRTHRNKKAGRPEDLQCGVWTGCFPPEDAWAVELPTHSMGCGKPLLIPLEYGKIVGTSKLWGWLENSWNMIALFWQSLRILEYELEHVGEGRCGWK